MATLRQLKAFVVTAEYKKMSEAAKRLYISQPTVSQIISDLEKEYDVPLFERHSKELIITPAGALLLEYARKIIAIHEALEQEMKMTNAIRPLRLGATITVGTNLMGKIISDMNQLYPDIDTHVTINNTGHIEQMLLHNELDVALVEGIIRNQEIISKPVISDSLCIICGKDHPFFNMDKLSIKDLHDQTFILREIGSGTRALFEQQMQSHNIPYKVKWDSASTQAIVDAVTKNIGLGFVSERCVSEKIKMGLIYKCPVDEISLKRFFYLCQNRKHPVTSSIKDFTAYIESLPADF